MRDLFIELLSEEIPARMQRPAAEHLGRAVTEALAALKPTEIRLFWGPRRLALAASVLPEVAATSISERGPRITAPEAALAGFLRKHNATRDDLRQEGDFLVLERQMAAQAAGDLVAQALPGLLRRFVWPKSMRWGSGSAFTWIRPLRRILCILDGDIVPFTLAEPGDDGHGLASANLTKGHRFHAPAPFAVASCAEWLEKLRDARVIADPLDRATLIRVGLASVIAAQGLQLVPDDDLVDEVTGLVEWPVPLIGRIDDKFMDLPPEVMQVSMRVNQRYFALRTADGATAPYFAFIANIQAEDGGAAVISGNERVLRARFADARHFWDLDRRTKLADRVPALDRVTFHAKLGSQGDRVRRIQALAEQIAPLVGAPVALASRAALLAKADLTTGMVGEFPELQGVMGSYYARHDGEDAAVADAVREHYWPRGVADAVPTAPVAIAVALADKLDQLAGLFSAGEKPSGAGDPFALRRAALGVIRIILENGLRVRLGDLLPPATATEVAGELRSFIIERLRVKLRADGARHDVLAAIFQNTSDDDIVRLIARAEAVAGFIATPVGGDLLAGYRRAANILRIEDKKDGPHGGLPDAALLAEPEEQALAAALDRTGSEITDSLADEAYMRAMAAMAALRAPLDDFFDKVTVNAADYALRRNRLKLLRGVQSIMNLAADFSRIEG